MAKGDGTIEELGPRRWRVRIQARDPRTGRKVSRSKIVEGSRTEARRALEKLRGDVREGSKPKRLRLRAFATSWIESRARAVAAGTMKPSVLRKYATSLDLHILKSPLGDMYVDSIVHGDVQDYVTARIGSGAAGNTVLNELRLLRTMSRDSFASGAAPRHWADRVKAPEVRLYDEDDPNALTPEQLMLLITHIPPQWLMMFGALAFTGLRWGELSALEWQDLDHHAGLIRVRRSNWKGRTVAVKTKLSKRRIPIPPYLAPPAPDATGLIFPTATGKLHRGTPLNKVIRRAIVRAREALCQAYGSTCPACAARRPPPARKPPPHACPYRSEQALRLMPDLTPHGLRRTYNDLLRAVAPELVVRAIQGWASGAMPAHYATVRTDEKKLAARRVLELVGLHQEGDADTSTPPTAPADGAQMEPSDDRA